MWRAKCIDGPAAVFTMSHQGTNADDRVEDVLGELVAHCGANFVIALADMAGRGGKALQVGNRLEVPNDDVAHVAHSTGCLFKSPLMLHLMERQTLSARALLFLRAPQSPSTREPIEEGDFVVLDPSQGQRAARNRGRS